MLAAVQALIIPIQCEYYGLEGISQLLNTVRLVQQNINPGLAIGGVLLTMYDSRLNLCRQVAEDATEYFGPKVFGTPIPRNVRLAEAPSFGKPILLYDMQSVGAKSYLAVGQELLRRVEGSRCRSGHAGFGPIAGGVNVGRVSGEAAETPIESAPQVADEAVSSPQAEESRVEARLTWSGSRVAARESAVTVTAHPSDQSDVDTESMPRRAAEPTSGPSRPPSQHLPEVTT